MAAEFPKPATQIVSFRLSEQKQTQIVDPSAAWFPTIQEALSLAKPKQWDEKQREQALGNCVRKIRCFGKDMPKFTQKLVIALHNAIGIWKTAGATKPNSDQAEAICNILNKEIKPVILNPQSFKNSENLSRFLAAITTAGENMLKQSFSDNSETIAELAAAEKEVEKLEKESKPDKDQLEKASERVDSILTKQRLAASLGQAAGTLLSILAFAGHANAATVAGDAFQKEIVKKEEELKELGYTYDVEHNTWAKKTKSAEEEKSIEPQTAIVEAQPSGPTAAPASASQQSQELATPEMTRQEQALFNEIKGLQLLRIRTYMTGYLGIQGEQLNAVRAAEAFLTLDPEYLKKPQTQGMRAAFENVLEGIALSAIGPAGSVTASRTEHEEAATNLLAFLFQNEFNLGPQSASSTHHAIVEAGAPGTISNATALHKAMFYRLLWHKALKVEDVKAIAQGNISYTADTQHIKNEIKAFIGTARVGSDEMTGRALFTAKGRELALLTQRVFPLDQNSVLETRYDEATRLDVPTKDVRTRIAELQQEALATPALTGSTDDTTLAVASASRK